MIPLRSLKSARPVDNGSTPQDRDAMTDPPCEKEMKGVFNQWIVFDHYSSHVMDYNRSEHSPLDGRSASMEAEDHKPFSRKNSSSEAQVVQEKPNVASTTSSRAETLSQMHGKSPASTETPPHPLMYDYCSKKNDAMASDQALLAIFTRSKNSKALLELSTKTPSYDLSSLARSSRILERMLNQNLDDNVLLDFRYWEDMADEFRDVEGTLLPLWDFVNPENARNRMKLSVTGISWSIEYPDLFAVSFGSCKLNSLLVFVERKYNEAFEFKDDFDQQQKCGYLSVFTLKNPPVPEYQFEMCSGAMCVAMHPQYAHLVAVGCYNGDIQVYDLKTNNCSGALLCESIAHESSHFDAVSCVSWIKDDEDGRAVLLSLSFDGFIVEWTILPGSSIIKRHDVLRVNIDPPIILADKSLYYTHVKSALFINTCGTALAFHHSDGGAFLVGTEEGLIYYGVTMHQARIVKKFAGHSMAVYGLCWNHYSDEIFASCGADWTVRIWDKRKDSTVIAVVTGNGDVLVFDLAEDRFSPICVQKVTKWKRSRCTTIAFNPVDPIVSVGDN
ncbi:unnamed protein product, partial [Notodromas monacha]